MDKMIHETDVEFHAESNEPKITALALTPLAQTAITVATSGFFNSDIR